MFPIHLDIGNVVFKNGGDVDLWRTSQRRMEGAIVGKVDVCRCSAGAGKCRSSRDAEGRIVGMLTSGKVPLEKTLMVERPMSATGMHRSFVRHDGDRRRHLH